MIPLGLWYKWKFKNTQIWKNTIILGTSVIHHWIWKLLKSSIKNIASYLKKETSVKAVLFSEKSGNEKVFLIFFIRVEILLEKNKNKIANFRFFSNICGSSRIFKLSKRHIARHLNTQFCPNLTILLFLVVSDIPIVAVEFKLPCIIVLFKLKLKTWYLVSYF